MNLKLILKYWISKNISLVTLLIVCAIAIPGAIWREQHINKLKTAITNLETEQVVTCADEPKPLKLRQMNIEDDL